MNSTSANLEEFVGSEHGFPVQEFSCPYPVKKNEVVAVAIKG